MIYRKFGKTGYDISLLGFGGMRFAEPANIEKSAEMLVHALDLGINYFDTAPKYCDDHSEDIFGAAVRELDSRKKPYYFSTKSQLKDGGELRRQLERSLKRLGKDYVDFYNCWYVLTPEDWAQRKAGGAVAAILKAKEEGLIRHPCFSTHLPGEQIRRVIEEGWFEGVTLGFSALNFPYREEGVAAAHKAGLGVVVMNPLGGGLLVNPALDFSFLRARPGQSPLEAALHFLFSDERIHVSLVGFSSRDQIDQAVAAVDSFKPYTPGDRRELAERLNSGMNSFCTSCRYCKDCPEDIPVWAFAETANYVLLGAPPAQIDFRIRSHWGAAEADMDRCLQCGACTEACTQRLPIMERFEMVKKALGELKSPAGNP
ncbi:MAG: aldo/keto reductase [Spirochaetales bacterium]|jgi:predicted aldo/keto reductase-like oxidoreductase|nr:aldo/keto reductase [Spirochaetales bacterium]